jgi:hypothetical protein
MRTFAVAEPTALSAPNGLRFGRQMEEQRLIGWKYRDELGPTEVGRLLDCSADVGRMRMKRAEDHLRRLLGPDHAPG